MPQNSPLPSPLSLASLVETSRADLAERLSLDSSQINLLEAASVVWPDASLGCPKHGRLYAQVLTPGYRILLEAGGKLYAYHAGRRGQAFYCDDPAPPVPGDAGDI